MKFYDRNKELTLINKLIKTTREKGSRILVVTGKRRIGKTRLILEGMKDSKHLYFFTKKKRIHEIINEWSEEIRSKYGNIFYGNFRNLEELLKFLFDFSQQNPLILAFDEIQNFLFSEPSAFGTFQKIFDLHREKSNALIIFLGSSFSLMNKIFKDSKEPLFGRASDIINLSYLPLKAQEDILKDHTLFSGKNLLHLFSIFDGIPKYIEELIDSGEKDFQDRVKSLLINREFLWEEGENSLKDEFGKEYSSYYTILSALAKGKRRMNEIEQFSGIRDVGPYLKNLEDIYKLTERRLPVTSKSKKEKKGRYYIKDNFLGFWFRFIEPKRILKEMNRKEMAFQEIWDQLPDFEGRKLEDMVIRKMIEENPLQIDFHKAGKYWDRKGLIELDAVFINERENKVYVFEVKTNKDKINKRQLRILYDKAKAIPEFFNQEINLGISYLEEDGLQIELV